MLAGPLYCQDGGRCEEQLCLTVTGPRESEKGCIVLSPLTVLYRGVFLFPSVLVGLQCPHSLHSSAHDTLKEHRVAGTPARPRGTQCWSRLRRRLLTHIEKKTCMYTGSCSHMYTRKDPSNPGKGGLKKKLLIWSVCSPGLRSTNKLVEYFRSLSAYFTTSTTIGMSIVCGQFFSFFPSYQAA